MADTDTEVEFTDYEDTRRELLGDEHRRGRVEDARVRAASELVDYTLGELRRALGVTQAELARRMEISQPTVSQLEHGPDPRISSLKRFAAALGGQVRLVVEFDDDTAPVGLDVGEAGSATPQQRGARHNEPQDGETMSSDRHVVPNPDEGWDVKKPDSKRASSHHDTQAEAIERAKEIVGNAGGGEVRIHGQDGKIRDSDTVPPGSDPHPPKDTKH